ncbi:MAG: ATP-binding protein [Candidatus Methanogasteraceae archaeon]
MKRIEFHDRGREAKEIMDILGSEPSLITFVYGPINSGKTTLVNHLLGQLPDEYVPFYVNLRGRFITGYEDFLNVLFEIDEGGVIDNVSEYAQSLIKDLKILSGIPIPLNLFEQIFEKKDKSKDMFKYIERFFDEMSKKRVPVLIIDELQVIGDLKIDGLLIYKLFNFFIRLTKEKHLAHVFVVTSDSLFIEQVYSEAMLSGRSRHILVDDFDYATTMDFLDKYGFSHEEEELAWEYCGGKPVYLMELINTRINDESIEKKVQKMFEVRKSQIRMVINELRLIGGELEYKGKKIEIVEERVIDALNSLLNTEYNSYEMVSIEEIYLVKKNILFIDAVRGVLKPQSKLDLLAVREVVGNA